MADEVDSLMAYIEGRSQKSIRSPPPSFTKQSLDELEFGIRNLAESCKNVKVPTLIFIFVLTHSCLIA
jgi:hypothetical protein